MNGKQKKGLTLSRKMSMIITVMIMVSAIAVGVLGFILYRGDCIRLAGERALDVAKSMAAAIDGDDLEQSLQTGEKTEKWAQAKQVADDIATDVGAEFLYVVDLAADGKMVTYYLEGYNPVVGSESLEMMSQEEADYFADEMYDALNNGRFVYSGMFTSGEFGRMVSGFAPVRNSAGAVVGVVGVDIGINDIMDDVNAFGGSTLVAVLAFSVLFGLISMRIVNRLVGEPIKILSTASGQIAVGDLDIDVDSINRSDEIGDLAKAFGDMARRTKRQVDYLQQIASGDFTVDVRSRGDNDLMGHAMMRLVRKMNEAFDEIRGSTEQVTMASAQIAAGSQTLAQGATEQSSTVDMLSESIDTISQTVEQNVDMADRASGLMDGIRENANKGTAQMDAMVDAVQQIDEASHAIENVMKVIDDIAFQTNILALNAAVEAARAGEHGKGFAVVADEVRNLAGKSADAAKETASLIDNSIQKSALGVDIAHETSTSFGTIVASIEESGGLIAAIASASQSQKDALEGIQLAASQVAQVSQQNSASAEESAASSEELNSQSDQLNHMLAGFQLKSGGPKLLN